MPRHDVAVYAPYASVLYEAEQAQPAGGAEFQTGMLAKGLAGEGLHVAHVVFQVASLRPPESGGVTVVERAPLQGRSGVGPRLAEFAAVWRAMREADAATYVFRVGSAALGVAALFCRRYRRRLVFATANNIDLTFESFEDNRPNREFYRLGIRWADAVVVQTSEQGQLARQGFPTLQRLAEIPSFAEPADRTTEPAEAFLWIGRIVSYKRPLEYLELARAIPDARFWMIARDDYPATPPELLRKVRERAAELPNVDITPTLPRPELLERMNRAVASVSTSRAEGMPNVFLEAWARGVPALTLSFDPDGRVAARGLGISAQGSWEDFVAGARRLWQERDQRDELAERVRAYVAATHSPAAVTERWLSLLRGLPG